MITFDAAKFAALAPMTSTGGFRADIRCINISPLEGGGVRMIATDGHILASYRDKDGSASASVTVRPSKPLLAAIAEALREAKGSKFKPTIRVDDTGGVSLVSHLDKIVSIFHDCTVDCAFPDGWSLIEKAIEKPVVNAGAAFNPDLLARLSKLAGRNGRVCVHVKGVDEPAVIQIDGNDDFIGLVMSYRKELGTTAPDWIKSAA